MICESCESEVRPRYDWMDNAICPECGEYMEVDG